MPSIPAPASPGAAFEEATPRRRPRGRHRGARGVPLRRAARSRSAAPRCCAAPRRACAPRATRSSPSPGPRPGCPRGACAASSSAPPASSRPSPPSSTPATTSRRSSTRPIPTPSRSRGPTCGACSCPSARWPSSAPATSRSPSRRRAATPPARWPPAARSSSRATPRTRARARWSRASSPARRPRRACPRRTFALLQSSGIEVGEALVDEPAIAAVGFTGSFAGGKALYDRAAARERPIPVFAEMGSVNPIVVTEAALTERSEAIAEGLAASVASFGGQLCTKPGVVFVPAGEAGDAFAADLGARLAARRAAGPAQRAPARRADRERSPSSAGWPSAVDGAATPAEPGFRFRPAAYRAAAADVREHPELLEERFGPVVLLLTYGSRDELLDALLRIDGQLTGSVHAQAQDARAGRAAGRGARRARRAADLRRLPDRRRGHPRHAPRRSVPGHHRAGAHLGGHDGDPPLPAPGRLPERARRTCCAPELQDANPLGIWRRVDGELTRERARLSSGRRARRRAPGASGSASDRKSRTVAVCSQYGQPSGSAGDAGPAASATGASQRGQASVPLARCPVRATRLSALAPASRVTGSGRVGLRAVEVALEGHATSVGARFVRASIVGILGSAYDARRPGPAASRRDRPRRARGRARS